MVKSVLQTFKFSYGLGTLFFTTAGSDLFIADKVLKTFMFEKNGFRSSCETSSTVSLRFDYTNLF